MNIDFFTIVGLFAVYTALRVITSSSPVNSVWNLVMVFANITILIFYLGVEYMGIIL
jgi:NADH:ubiquinone oxidoreductase subunit 6 (subunit J)